MARIKRGVSGIKHRRRVMKLVKGFRAARRRNYRVANEALLKSLAYAFRDRRVRKRDFRTLWISRINAAVRREGISYSVFMHGLKKSGVTLNRKALADLALTDQKAFGALLNVAKDAMRQRAGMPPEH
ncbi:MAG: 50S ribosomal protein L20 [Candidatus Eremiobacteraeota bacterium]|nr:50S ribosomal protein L20 [Candidatus Eremiobacteraeota bacterium]MBV9057266.1 50S ribosomal protein L20 [Candidatus Eremiobacteraeota bacterium]MBV9700457.1 50S ribosomal protein L20 [Candidatus Eremiobacteraeota bacterium]